MRININEFEFEKYGLETTDSNFSKIAVNYIQDNYFNGVDNAVIYMGYHVSDDNIIFEFDILPN